MSFTVFGAGAIGTLFAAKVAQAGHSVTVVARGARRQSVETNGLVLRARRSGETQVVRVPVFESLLEAPQADFILVTVRAQQVDAIMSQLLAAQGDVVMLVNTAAGYGPWAARLGSRLLGAFPGAICHLAADGVLTWEFAPRLLQPTVLGEPAGGRSERVNRLAEALRSATIPVQVRTDMERWIRTHAGWMTPFMLTAASGRLEDPLVVRRWMQATKEGLRAVRVSGPLAPLMYRGLQFVPLGLLTGLARLVLRSPSIRKHVVEAGVNVGGEGRLLAAELLAQAEAPALRELMTGSRSGA